MSTDQPFDAFLSHSGADKPAVETLAQRLRSVGIHPWLDKWQLIPGESWQEGLEKGLRESSVCVVFFGPGGVGPWHVKEMRAAISQNVSNRESFRVVPVLLPGATEPERDVPLFLQGMTWVEFRESLDDADAFHRLVCGIRGVEPGSGAETNPVEVRPSVWTVPYRRNPNFTGRSELLEELERSLESGDVAAVTQARAVHGLGGVGKTQLAVEFAYRHRDRYEAVLWVEAEDSRTIAGNYARLAGELGLSAGDDTDEAATVAVVRDWLESHGQWLLILDNAVQRADVLPYLPRQAAGAVVITSRNPDWLGVAQPLSVPVLPRPEAIALLHSRTGESDSDAAGALAEALGDLPLALAQAGGYIASTRA